MTAGPYQRWNSSAGAEEELDGMEARRCWTGPWRARLDVGKATGGAVWSLWQRGCEVARGGADGAGVCWLAVSAAVKHEGAQAELRLWR